MCIPSNLGMNGGGVPPNGMNGGGLAGATDLIGGEPDYFEVDVHYLWISRTQLISRCK
jgi:hypothetical protein